MAHLAASLLSAWQTLDHGDEDYVGEAWSAWFLFGCEIVTRSHLTHRNVRQRWVVNYLLICACFVCLENPPRRGQKRDALQRRRLFVSDLPCSTK